MFYKTKSWKNHISSVALILSLSLANITHVSAVGDEWIEGELSTHCPNFRSFAYAALMHHKPFEALRSEELKRQKELFYKGNHITDEERKKDLEEFHSKRWAELEKQQSNPLLRAVCIREQLDYNHSQQESLMLFNRLLSDLILASEGYKEAPKTALQIQIFAAREAEYILKLVNRKGFIKPHEAKEVAELSSLIYRPSELWASIAKNKDLQNLDVHALGAFFPERQPHEERNHDKFILETYGVERIKRPSNLGDEKRWHETDDEYIKRRKSNAEIRENYLIAIKAGCYLRALFYSNSHFFSAARTELISFIGSQEKELDQVLRGLEKTSKYVSRLAARIDEPQSTFFLSLLTADLKDTVLRNLSKTVGLSEQSQKRVKRESKLATPFIKQMYKQSLEHKDAIPQSWMNRTLMVRAQYGLAMQTKKTEKKKQRLQDALEWSKLREGPSEYDPTNHSYYSNAGYETSLYRYDRGDLVAQGKWSDLPTWQQALQYQLAELEGAQVK